MLELCTCIARWKLAMRKWSAFSLRTRPRFVRPQTSISAGRGFCTACESVTPLVMEPPPLLAAPCTACHPAALAPSPTALMCRDEQRNECMQLGGIQVGHCPVLDSGRSPHHEV